MRHLFVVLLVGCGVDSATISPAAPQALETVPPQPTARQTAGPACHCISAVPAPAPEPRPLTSGLWSRVLRSATSVIALDLNDSTVFCSEQGYGTSVLKVSMPDLEWLAHLDHRVEASGLPCAAAGACGDDFGPAHVLQSRPGFEVVPVTVTLTEAFDVDVEHRTCARSLSEVVQATVRGVPLRHVATGPSSPVDFEACELLASRGSKRPSWGP